jgi:glycosyltransferase involved in cell wall biosynthesis
MRILISAYACAPGRVSEPEVGWNRARPVSRSHDVWVLLPENEREAVQGFLRRKHIDRIQFVFCDLPAWIRPSNKNTNIRFAPHYCLWQIEAWRAARPLHKQNRFDIVHRITLGAYRKPSLPVLMRARFLPGPAGGGESQRTAEPDPLLRLTMRRSTLAIAKTVETRDRLRVTGARQTLVMSDAAISAEDLHQLGVMPVGRGKPLRLRSLGRLVHRKGFELSLRALTRSHQTAPDAEYWLVGDGLARKRLTEIARHPGVSQSECDVPAHPGLHDSGGWVCPEAMAAARPVVCLDAGGPGVQVTSETGITGIKVRPEYPEQVIRELAAAFRALSGDPALRERPGAAGQARVRELFAWERRREQLLDLYSQPAGDRASESAAAGSSG